MELNQMNLFNQDTTTSPFDAIKQTDGANEWWSARDLMRLMGYSSWQKFENPLMRAMATARNQGHEVERLFTRSVNKSQGGRPATDFLLARYAAYLVSMNGDPNMSEVAAAQDYFAIRAREAEVSQPRQIAQTEDEKVMEVMQILQGRVQAALEQVAELEPKANAWTQFLSSTGDLSVNEAAKALSRNSAHVVGERKFRSLMESWNWIYRDHNRKPRAYQAQIDNGRLAERAKTHRNPITGELVQDVPQVRVTAKGLDAARDILSMMDR